MWSEETPTLTAHDFTSVHDYVVHVDCSTCVTLCYAGSQMEKFDQEVISSSLPLEDPDLNVRESTSLVLWLLV